MMKTFKTARGETTFVDAAICAFCVVTEPIPRKIRGTKDVRYVDVHLHSGTVFTIQPEDVERFLMWMERSE